MPRKNPQLSASVSVETYGLLRRMSAATGQSMSSLVAELIETAKPQLELILQALDAAETHREELPFVIQNMLNTAAGQLGEAQVGMSEIWNTVRRNKASK